MAEYTLFEKRDPVAARNPNPATIEQNISDIDLEFRHRRKAAWDPNHIVFQHFF